MTSTVSRVVGLVAVTAFLLLLSSSHAAAQLVPPSSSDSGAGRSNTWAVVVSSSRYLFNYRHTANALTMYHLLRQHGIDDDHILLFLSDSFACDPRNPYPAAIYSVTDRIRDRPNLYGCSAQVDYAGDDVDVRRFLNVLQGRYDENTPPTRRLLSDENSNILIYVAGHGAKSFFKFQDSEFLSSSDLSETFSMMHAQKRYGKVVFLADTCHAIALCESITAPNVVCVASSDAENESYSHHPDALLGVSMISTWMYEALRLLEDANCSDPTAGTYVAPPMTLAARGDVEEEKDKADRPATSVLHQSWYEFNYSPARLNIEGEHSEPAHRDAVNDPAALVEWKVSDFVCGTRATVNPVSVRYDLL